MNLATKFSIIHGLVKGALKNIIDLVHSRIPKDELVKDSKSLNNIMPELANVLDAVDEALIKFKEYNSNGNFVEGHQSYDLMIKLKEIFSTAVANDTAYYLMLEYFLKSYIHLKFKGTEVEDKIEGLYQQQWEERMEELLNGTSKSD